MCALVALMLIRIFWSNFCTFWCCFTPFQRFLQSFHAFCAFLIQFCVFLSQNQNFANFWTKIIEKIIESRYIGIFQIIGKLSISKLDCLKLSVIWRNYRYRYRNWQENYRKIIVIEKNDLSLTPRLGTGHIFGKERSSRSFGQQPGADTWISQKFFLQSSKFEIWLDRSFEKKSKYLIVVRGKLNRLHTCGEFKNR